MTGQLFLTLLVVAFTTPLVAAQDVALRKDRIIVQPFNRLQLPQNEARAILHDSRGYMWVGTRSGVVRYKSGRQHQWRDGDLPSSRVIEILEDKIGRVWVLTPRGLAAFDHRNESWKKSVPQKDKMNSSRELKGMTIDPVGRLWMIDHSGALFCVDTETLEITEFDTNLGSVYEDYPARELREPMPTRIHSAADGTLFTSVYKGGLLRIDVDHDSQTTNINLQLPPQYVVTDFDINGSVIAWITSDLRAGYIDIPTDSISELNMTSVSHLAATGVLPPVLHHDSAGSVWIAVGSRIIKVGEAGELTIGQSASEASDIVEIVEDRSGRVWLGAHDGVSYIVEPPFSLIVKEEGDYSFGEIRSVYEDKGTVVLGGQGVWIGDIDGVVIPPLQISDEAHAKLRFTHGRLVSKVLKDGNRLFIGYYEAGFDVLSLDSGDVQQIKTGAGESFKETGVAGISKVGPNRYLIAMFHIGLLDVSFSDDDSIKPDITLGGRALGMLNTLPYDETLALVATESALFRYWLDSKKLEKISLGTDEDWMSTDLIFDLDAVRDGDVYIGTESKGLLMIGAQDVRSGSPTLIRVGQQYDLDNQTVWGVLVQDGYLWASTNFGLVSVNLTTGSRIAYGPEQGLPEVEFQQGGTAKSSRGRMYFVSEKGPVVFDDLEQPRNVEANVVLASLKINGENLVGDARLDEVGAGSYRLKLEYNEIQQVPIVVEAGVLDPLAETHNIWMLSTDGSSWQGRLDPSITLSQLMPGETTVKITISDSDGAPASDYISVSIFVGNPWYKVGDVDIRIVAVVAIVVGSIAGIYIFYLRRKGQKELRESLRREAFMEGEASQKDLRLKEIQHRTGNILAAYTSAVSTQLHRAKDPETVAALTTLMERVSIQASVHQLLQKTKDDRIPLHILLSKIVDGIDATYLGRGEKSRVKTVFEPIKIKYSDAQMVGMIVSELITNAYKHINQPRAKYEISVRDVGEGKLAIDYKDNGPGMSAEAIKEGTSGRAVSVGGGLRQVVALVKELRGELNIEGDAGVQLHAVITPRQPKC